MIHRWPSARLPSDRRGFTLMEVLVSMTIVAIVVTIVSGALRLGVRAWEKGEADMDASQRQRAILGLMARQLGEIVTGEHANYAANPMALRGGRTRIEYVSGHPVLLKGSEWLVLARFDVVQGPGRTVALHYTETPFVAAVNPAHTADIEAASQTRILSENVYDIAFAYLGPPDTDRDGDAAGPDSTEWMEPPWQDTWDPADQKKYPRAVRISLTSHAADPPMRMIVPVQSV